MVSVWLLLLVACQPRTQRDPVADAVQAYLRLSLALGEHDVDSLDYYAGPPQLVAAVHAQTPTLEAIHAQVEALEMQLAALCAQGRMAADRCTQLQAQVSADAARARMLEGRFLPFDAESRALFDVVAPTDTAAQAAARAQVRVSIARLLGQPHADAAQLAQAIDRLEATQVVPEDKVAAVMQRALAVCRAATLEHLALPAEEHVDVVYVVHQPWSAYSRYLGHAHSRIELNVEFPLTVDRILELACHEGYPGHHVYNLMHDRLLVPSRPELAVQPTFSPLSFVSEAAASYAPELAMPYARRLQVEREVLAPLAGVDARQTERVVQLQSLLQQLDTAEPSIARQYLDGQLEYARAIAALEHEALMPHGEALLLYINEYRSYMLTYTVGHDRLRAWVQHDGSAPAAQWRRYQQLLTHSVTPREMSATTSIAR
jgi:hypothetical protein